jgi:hypothetical protein
LIGIRALEANKMKNGQDEKAARRGFFMDKTPSTSAFSILGN